MSSPWARCSDTPPSEPTPSAKVPPKCCSTGSYAVSLSSRRSTIRRCATSSRAACPRNRRNDRPPAWSSSNSRPAPFSGGTPRDGLVARVVLRGHHEPHADATAAPEDRQPAAFPLPQGDPDRRRVAARRRRHRPGNHPGQAAGLRRPGLGPGSRRRGAVRLVAEPALHRPAMAARHPRRPGRRSRGHRRPRLRGRRGEWDTRTGRRDRGQSLAGRAATRIQSASTVHPPCRGRHRVFP